jgi:regulator of sigma E protease
LGERAGLKAGDLITQAGTIPVDDLNKLYEVLEKAGGEAVALTVRRGEENVALTLSTKDPAPAEKGLQLGISWGRMTLVHPSPTEQIQEAVLTIGNMLDALFSPKSDLRAQHFSGPVGILRAYYNLFDSEEGWRLALAFSVFFNVNLGLFNLLPFPVLDGGHVTLALLEAIRRKPIGGRFLEGIQTACALLVMTFLAYVTFFDVSGFFTSKKITPPAAPAAPATPPAK